jgi:hypothetical protein
MALLLAIGSWTYLQRVLIAHQISYAATHDRPRGNLSDLYPRWLGARELLLHKRNPYGADISREIQAGYYGRPLDPARASDPKDEQRFAYPIYVVFFLAPTIGLPFAPVQAVFFWLLVVLLSASLLLWIKILRWPITVAWKASLLLFAFGGLDVMQGLKLQQMSLLVFGLLSVAIFFLIRGYPVIAGVLMGVATIKPQLVVLLLCWLTLWTVSDWRPRGRWAISFLLTMVLLFAASEWILPHWLPLFGQAVRDYRVYTSANSILGSMLGAPAGYFFELIAYAATLAACWKARRCAASSPCFAFILCLVLASTVLLLPSSSTYNQVLLFPATLLLIKDCDKVWTVGPASRVLFVSLMGLVCWPRISGAVLAALSFVLPPASFERAWALPTWTVTPIPVAAVALMVVYWQGATFEAPSEAGSS